MPGTVDFANWKFTWKVSSLQGSGLAISLARFDGKTVLFSIEQPFVLVPYHGDNPTFKNGRGPACGGVPYTAMTPIAPNAHQNKMLPKHFASNDNAFHPVTNPGGAVFLEKLPANLIQPARVVLWAKFQALNFQYIHHYEFQSDGNVRLSVGLGGEHLSIDKARAHINNFYFRLDFDILGFADNLVQRFGHSQGQDDWSDVLIEWKRIALPEAFEKWRVVNKILKPTGMARSYEIIPGSGVWPDGKYSTADIWAVMRKVSEDGSDVLCDDSALNKYAGDNSMISNDVVVWYCLREHHEPRYLGEEFNVLPYHFLSFDLKPRDFLDTTPKNLYTTDPPSPF